MIKYFDAASVDRGLYLEIISGIMAKRFISRPTHIINILLLNIVMIGPKITVE